MSSSSSNSYTEMRTLQYVPQHGVNSAHSVSGQLFDQTGAEDNLDHHHSHGNQAISGSSTSNGMDQDDIRSGSIILDQERFLPIANVARVMKRMIPSTGKIAKDAKECVQECVSEFISFITSEASDKCIAEKRKTISADDLLEAMVSLGFDNYIEPLKIFLDRYRCAHKILMPQGGRIYNIDLASVVCDDDDGTNRVHIEPSAGNSSGTHPYNHPVMMTVEQASTGNGVSTTYQSTSSDMSVPIVMEGSAQIALEQQPMQIFVDPTSRQHYMSMETPDGLQLFPITIQTDGPMAIAVLPEEHNTSQEGQQFVMMSSGDTDDTSAKAMFQQPIGNNSASNNQIGQQAEFSELSQPIAEYSHSQSTSAEKGVVTRARSTRRSSQGKTAYTLPVKRARHS